MTVIDPRLFLWWLPWHWLAFPRPCHYLGCCWRILLLFRVRILFLLLFVEMTLAHAIAIALRLLGTAGNFARLWRCPVPLADTSRLDDTDTTRYLTHAASARSGSSRTRSNSRFQSRARGLRSAVRLVGFLARCLDWGKGQKRRCKRRR